METATGTPAKVGNTSPKYWIDTYPLTLKSIAEDWHTNAKGLAWSLSEVASSDEPLTDLQVIERWKVIRRRERYVVILRG